MDKESPAFQITVVIYDLSFHHIEFQTHCDVGDTSNNPGFHVGRIARESLTAKALIFFSGCLFHFFHKWSKSFEPMATNSIHCLPVHILRLVLCQLDTIRSLGCAILSHSLFYVAFNEDSHTVVIEILALQIDLRLLPFARAVQEADAVDNSDPATVETFLEDRLDERNPDAGDWSRLRSYQLSIPIAAAISKLHTIVDYFTDDFASRTLPYCEPPLGIRHRKRYPSLAESYRIQRALYRFQLYCSLFFRNASDLAPNSDRRQKIEFILHMGFFHYFSSWENEQLACMHDYLEKVLSDGKLLDKQSKQQFLLTVPSVRRGRYP